MIRRTALAGGLVAAIVLSSCSSHSAPGSDAVAAADGVELSRDTLQQLVGPSTAADGTGAADAGDVRSVMTDWLRLAVTGADMAGVTTREALEQQLEESSTAYAEPLLDEARAIYDKGWDGSPSVCLALIPVAEGGDPQDVIDALDGGMSIAEAAQQFSSDPALAESGGVVTFQDGTNCAAPGALNPAIGEQMAGTLPGEPVVLVLTGGQGVVVIRPFDDLTTTQQIGIDPSVQARFDIARAEALAEADIWVDSRFGRWVPSTATVEALFAG